MSLESQMASLEAALRENTGALLGQEISEDGPQVPGEPPKRGRGRPRKSESADASAPATSAPAPAASSPATHESVLKKIGAWIGSTDDPTKHADRKKRIGGKLAEMKRPRVSDLTADELPAFDKYVDAQIAEVAGLEAAPAASADPFADMLS